MTKREQALEFIQKYVADEYQLHHAEMVEAAMRSVAKHLNEDEEKFGLTGLIHDWDYDQWPAEHPGRYEQLQSELDWVDVEIIDSIEGHSGINSKRDTVLAKALFACDEFSGLLYAYMKMVGNFADMKTKSIRKKVYKDLNFAAKIDRQDIVQGIQELGIDENTFFELIRDTFSQKYD